MPLVYIKTFGCQMNEYDSEAIRGLLSQNGFQLTDNLPKADLIILNTCYVREKVKHKIFSLLGELKKLKKQNPNLLLGVGGCLAQKESQEILKRAPFVDIIWGTSNFHKLPEFLKRVKESKFPVAEIENIEKERYLPHNLPLIRKKRFSAYIPVIRGCDNFCTYCNVPYVRGREKSRPLEFILKEIDSAISEGCKEIILLGQNVNSYGKDFLEKIDFSDLLSKINEVKGIHRIRFITSHPKDLSDKLILAMAKLDKVCEHLHLPLQAVSNRVLKLMRRSYTSQDYLALVDKVRYFIPGITLTTDLIVGFPGESEEDFQDTLNMVEKIRFDGAFTFEYSLLSGTRAAEFENQIPLSVKKSRIRELIDVQRKITERKNKIWVGRKLEVLVEGLSPKNPQELAGRTKQDKIVIFPGDISLIGQFLEVKVMESGCWALKGERVSESC